MRISVSCDESTDFTRLCEPATLVHHAKAFGDLWNVDAAAQRYSHATNPTSGASFLYPSPVKCLCHSHTPASRAVHRGDTSILCILPSECPHLIRDTLGARAATQERTADIRRVRLRYTSPSPFSAVDAVSTSPDLIEPKLVTLSVASRYRCLLSLRSRVAHAQHSKEAVPIFARSHHAPRPQLARVLPIPTFARAGALKARRDRALRARILQGAGFRSSSPARPWRVARWRERCVRRLRQYALPTLHVRVLAVWCHVSSSSLGPPAPHAC
ncbi:hypothetical protein B0H17DRAFT_1328877 [Mycena rosella]|uniref:Uncharacterized protein n=1 Tax=Mycena rosella TaxID=1033263 RepID=A0AAD7DQH8_MYCRO|nr:hypothetical protein B0H17DRAFT_1328877 [Mycena rosella]